MMRNKRRRDERLERAYRLSQEDAEELLLEVDPCLHEKKKAERKVSEMPSSLYLMPEGVLAHA